jgi:hypothetical protein
MRQDIRPLTLISQATSSTENWDTGHGKAQHQAGTIDSKSNGAATTPLIGQTRGASQQ